MNKRTRTPAEQKAWRDCGANYNPLAHLSKERRAVVNGYLQQCATAGRTRGSKFPARSILTPDELRIVDAMILRATGQALYRESFGRRIAGAKSTHTAAKIRAAEIRRVYLQLKNENHAWGRRALIAATVEHFQENLKKTRKNYGARTIEAATAGL